MASRLVSSCLKLSLITIIIIVIPVRSAAWDAPGTSGQVEQIVRTALENNPSLKSQRAKVKAAGQVISQAGALPDPMADIEFMNISVDNPDLSDSLTEGISLGVTQAIPYPGKRKAAVAVAEREVQMELAKLHAMESEVRAQVTGAVYSIASIDELLSLNGQARLALAAAAETAASVYASGSGTLADVVMAQSEAAKTLAEREGLETRKKIATARLKSLSGGDLDEGATGGITLPDPGELPQLNTLLASIPADSPEVIMAKSGAATEEARVGVAKLASKPDFTVGGRYRFRDMTMGGGDYLTAMVGISLPFFRRKDRYQPMLQEALFKRESAGYEVDGAIEKARYELSEAYEMAASAARLHRLYTEGLLVQARQAYESSLSSYSSGKADFSSVLTALTGLYDIMGSAAMAKGDYQQALAEIVAASGGKSP